MDETYLKFTISVLGSAHFREEADIRSHKIRVVGTKHLCASDNIRVLEDLMRTGMASAMLSVLPLLGLLLCAAVASASPNQLHFNADGQFKILQVADMHYANGVSTSCLDVLPEQEATCSDLNTSAFLRRLIAKEDPDLIVFTGDNIFQADCAVPTWSIYNSFAPAIIARKPWAAVLGNHDQEGQLSRSQVMAYITTLPYTVAKYNPVNEPDIHGFGTYNLEVMGAVGSTLQDKSVLNLYLLDSGDYSDDPDYPGYGWIDPTQQYWLTNISARLQSSYKSPPQPQPSSAPALAYFHIPLPEVVNLSDIVGEKNEDISCPTYNSETFRVAVEAGDIKAIFTGHDHRNDFCGCLSDISLCYAGGFGYHAYGTPGWPRRARLVQASLIENANGNWGEVGKIITWKRLDDEAFSTKDTQVLWTQAQASE